MCIRDRFPPVQVLHLLQIHAVLLQESGEDISVVLIIGLPLRVASVNALLSMGMQSTVTGLPASMYGQVCRNSHRPRMMVSGFAIRSSYLVKIRCCRREDLVAVLLFHRFEPLSLRELMVPSAEAVFRMRCV